MNPFKCNTIEQFKIGAWLSEQGLRPKDIAFTELLDRDKVKITNYAGQYMIIRWVDDHAEIDQT